jgi:hypothetical protein
VIYRIIAPVLPRFSEGMLFGWRVLPAGSRSVPVEWADSVGRRASAGMVCVIACLIAVII